MRVLLVLLVLVLVVLRPRDEEQQQHGALSVVVLRRVLALVYCMGLSLRPGFLWSYA